MSRRSSLHVLAGLAVAAMSVYLPATMSSASFTAQTKNVDSTVAAAPDWVPPVVAMDDPGAVLRGTVTLSATASDPGGTGVENVRFERAARGGATWTPTGTATAAPYTAAFDSRTVPDGPLDLRAVATDRAGFSATTPTYPTIVDNSLVRGVDVQAFNGGELGRIDDGDVLELTYSHRLQPGTIVAGWDGSSRSVAVRIDGSLTGTDILTVLSERRGDPVPVGSVDLKGHYVSRLFFFHGRDATMTAEATTRNGLPVTVIRIELGGWYQGTETLLSFKDEVAMEWTPAAGPRDVFGIGMNTATVTETGQPPDRDF